MGLPDDGAEAAAKMPSGVREEASWCLAVMASGLWEYRHLLPVWQPRASKKWSTQP